MPVQIHSEPFSLQLWSICSNKWPPNCNWVPSHNYPEDQDLPLSIPDSSCFPHWQQHTFPRQGDFVNRLPNSNTLARYARTQLWQCSSSMSSIIRPSKNSHTTETQKDNPHTTCPGINQSSKQVWSPYNLQDHSCHIESIRDKGTHKCLRKQTDMMNLCLLHHFKPDS